MSGNSAIILGVGPGLGAALVRRFRKHGLSVAAVARNRDKLEQLFADDDGVTAIGADATDDKAVAEAVAQAEKDIGPIEVAVANGAAFKIVKLLDTSAEDFENMWRQGCLAAFHLARHAGKAMAGRGKGSLLFTGSTNQMRAGPGFAAMAVAKSGLRALTHAAARELGPMGIHVAHVMVDGPIDSERTRASNSDHNKLIDPAGIAEAFHFLHTQPRAAWSNELDLRTFSEWQT